MCVRSRTGSVVPELTVRVARACNPHGTTAMAIRDHLNGLWSDEDFEEWYPRDGKPGLSPAQLATVSVLQFLLELSDRQAAESVRNRIDFKYAMGMELEDPGSEAQDLPEQVTPEDSHGAIGMSRFRRSLGWHIARRLCGLVALALQYGHMCTVLDAWTSSAKALAAAPACTLSSTSRPLSRRPILRRDSGTGPRQARRSSAPPPGGL
ncbi:transposase [Streptomyces sp. NPDC059802]|uniref:transposase n=1 Tax=Streptomyces sp. NPDC059802 TaxID=3346952 RepID=UPI00364867D9